MKEILSRMRTNWKSGLTVALVSIPLSVSLAVASNSAPAIGIITAIWAGLIASAFGGSNYDIMGPAGALTGILFGYASLYGADKLPLLAIVAGVFIMIAYFFKLEKYMVFIPASTVYGFTLGVAFTIGLGQRNFALGLDKFFGTALPGHPDAWHNYIETFKNLGSANVPTFIIFAIFLVALFVLVKLVPKIPGAILVSPIGILLGYFAKSGKLPFALQTLGDKYPDMTAQLFQLHSYAKSDFTWALVAAGLTVAVVAILETMLCAKIADGSTGTKHNKRREMFALGLANIGSGLAGGLPATAVLARSAINVRSGANSRMSQGLNAVFVFIIAFLLLSTFKFIPLAVIAAILIFSAIRMVETHHFMRMFRNDKKSFAIGILVAAITVYWDPSWSILIGTVIALLLFMERISKGQFDLHASELGKGTVVGMSGEESAEIPEGTDTLVYSIKGQLAYINAQAHISRFEEGSGKYKNIILRLRELLFIDLDGVDALDELIGMLESQGKKVLVSSTSSFVESNLKESKRYDDLKKKGLVFDHTAQALTFLGYKK